MSSSEIVLLAIAAVIGIILFMRVVRTIFRLIFILAVVGAIYYFWSGKTVVESADLGVETLFQNTTITELMAKHCPPAQLESLRCRCAIVPAYHDFQSRFRPEQISTMQSNRTRMIAETAKSLGNIRSEMGKCFEEKKDKTIGIFQKMRELYQLISQ